MGGHGMVQTRPKLPPSFLVREADFGMDGGVGHIFRLRVLVPRLRFPGIVGEEKAWEGAEGFRRALGEEVVARVEGCPPLVEDVLEELSVCGEGPLWDGDMGGGTCVQVAP